MKNAWLERFRIGRRVRYKGLDAELAGKLGRITRMIDNWVDVLFEFPKTPLKPQDTKIIGVEKESLEIVQEVR